MLHGLHLQPTEELIQKTWADKAGKAHTLEAVFGLAFHASSPPHCYNKRHSTLHKQSFKLLYKHGQVKNCFTLNANLSLCFSLFWQEQISAEIEITGSILTNSPQFWNWFLVWLLNTRAWELKAKLSRWFALDVVPSLSKAVQVPENEFHIWVLIVKAIYEKGNFPKAIPMNPLRKSSSVTTA